MNHKYTVFSAITALTFLMATPASAKDLYMATTGINSGDCTNEESPCRDFKYIFSKMSGGDTLYIDDGTYTSKNNKIWQFKVPPSGSPGAFTVIRAKNIPCQGTIPCNQPLKVKFSGDAKFSAQSNNNITSYVKFWGIRWDGIATYTGWDHIYFKQVASQGIVDGNSSAISIAGQNNLLEDVVVFGKGRYKILFYDYSRNKQSKGDGNNICRRCIVRHDWAMKNDIDPEPIAGITSYYNRGTACLNCIVIDSDTPSEWHNSPTELAGAFLQAVDRGAHAFEVKGSIVINTALPVLANRGLSTGHIIQDLAAVKTASGLFLRGQTDVDNVTLIDVGVDNFSYRSTEQESKILGPNDGVKLYDGDGPITFNNAIIKDIAGDGVDGAAVTSNGINMFQISGKDYFKSKKTSSFMSTDPFQNGLAYPIRIEANSPLATQGNGDKQIGANITHKLGKDGTFKGDSNWETEQSELWPWPLEQWIKSEMRTSEYTTDAKRGFAADNQSLTNYIWGYLGNTVPPFSVKASSKNGQVIVTWDKPAAQALSSITSFNIYDVSQGKTLIATVNGNTTYSKNITNLTTGMGYEFAVTAVDKNKGESAYSYKTVGVSFAGAPPGVPTDVLVK